jgi:predicted glycoside hydrolase/deacetylase ChbG (UPF0249 family)
MQNRRVVVGRGSNVLIDGPGGAGQIGGNGSAGAARATLAPRHIWLCADDYGISTGVSAAIRDLVVRGRINATSVMVVAPSFHRSEAVALGILNSGMNRVAIGLHLTLTAPFHPLSAGYRPTRQDKFLPLQAMLARSVLHRLSRDALEREIAAQLRMFIHTFGRAPDFIDGHQHVHLFPQIRDAVLKVAAEGASGAWLRQCGRAGPVRLSLRNRKALLLDFLSLGFRERAAALGLRTNPGFAGAYRFRESADFAALFDRFLDGLPDGGVVMCHPGLVDAELQRLDSLTTLREREYAFLAGESLLPLLAKYGVALA